jgi:acyl-CoA thioesterase
MKAPDDPQALAQACADAMWADDRASPSLGMTLDHVAPGTARMSMTVTERMVNGHGMCHGGLIFTLADSTFAFACNSRNQRAVAAQCAITFLRPARLGERLTATAAMRASAGRTGIYDIAVTNEAGVPVAEFRGHSRDLGQTFFDESGNDPEGTP